jgi:hypothetical protein
MLKCKKILPLFLLLALASCGRSYLSVRREWVDGRYLASTHVSTPDPRQAHPPFGQNLVISWWVPSSILAEQPDLVLQVIYWNFTQKTFVYPLQKRIGYKVCCLLDEQYQETGGLLTYRAQVVTKDGRVFKEWKHQLWVNLIEEEKVEPPERLPPPPYQPSDVDDEYYGSYPEPAPELLITLEERTSAAERMSSSVEDQSRQGSVIETPDFLSEGSSESN